jgi:hypothetical protein
MEFIILNREQAASMDEKRIHGREVRIPSEMFIYPMVLGEAIKRKLILNELNVIHKDDITFFPETDD